MTEVTGVPGKHKLYQKIIKCPLIQDNKKDSTFVWVQLTFYDATPSIFGIKIRYATENCK